MASKGSEIEGLDFYTRLEKHLMTDGQLRANGYPRASDSSSTVAKYYEYKNKDKDVRLKDNERICRRCTKTHLVKEDGCPATKEECRYHYGNVNRQGGIGRYACCQRSAGSQGCQIADAHVHEYNRYHNLTGYVTTQPAPRSDSRNTKVLSLDCEMLFTKVGMDLARVTVVDDQCHVVYEALVKPDTDIVDYNTRFSGISARDYRTGEAKSQREVQADLLRMISDKTILIGHSLESDMTALKMIHSTVVDTSLVFPHKRGLPYKRALRNLVSDHLNKTIQAQAGGHDSKEDAVACIQLMLYKVKQERRLADLKRRVRELGEDYY